MTKPEQKLDFLQHMEKLLNHGMEAIEKYPPGNDWGRMETLRLTRALVNNGDHSPEKLVEIMEISRPDGGRLPDAGEGEV